MLASILLVILGLCCCTKQSSQFQLDWPEFSVPSEALVMDIVDLVCGISYPVDDERIHLQIFKQGDREVILGEYTLSAGESFASIPRQIKAEDEGYLECVASVQNNTEINATVSAAHFIRVVEPVQGARIINTGPNELFAGNNLELQCKAEVGNHLSYKWFLDGSLIASSSFQEVVDNWLKIPRVSFENSGSYTCVAENAYNATLVFSSNSSEVVITVKEQASSTFPPDLMYVSFTVVKEDDHRYAAIVTCQTAGGDLPVTFSLYKDNELISNESFPERRAAFKVPVVLEQQSGELRCQANSGDQTRSSHTIPFEIASVAGPVTVVSDYDMAKNYAVIFLRLHCSPAKGTHPRFQWYLNQTPLHGQGSFYRVDHQPPKLSTLLLSVGSSSSGEYHCEVWDSFDNSTAISSKSLYVDKEALNRLPTAVVAVVFGCFTFLILLVSFCCLSGVVYRWKRRQQKREPSFEMDRELVVPEDEMDFTVYSEDDDVPRAPSDELYQESEASEDEWPQIEQEKSTLEN
ncbi:titin [Fundulus heteroclitus]|uniref:titin n=1 Tax=Fundulus heteroclitus TaxID=8078 RepID=UPI00165B39D3|nr:titin [Fundulus heteroclitus]